MICVYTASIKLLSKQAWICFQRLSVQVTGHIWTNGTQGRCKMRQLAVPDVEIMSTVDCTLKSMSAFYLQCSRTCWVVCWTEVQNLAGIDIIHGVFYCTAICGRRAKDIVGSLTKISACCWSKYLFTAVIALHIGWEFCIPLRKGKEAHAFHIVQIAEINLWACGS